MTPTYFAILTAIGEAKLANATVLGTTLKLTEMAVGDGAGEQPMPDRQQTTLVNECRRAAINTLSVDLDNANQIIAEQIIPEADGGWWIREIGLVDADGDLCAVANCPPTYKPKLAEGSGRTQVIRMILVVTSTQAVELKIDPSVVLATRQYVDRQLADARRTFAPLDSPAFIGEPTAPTPPAQDQSQRLATTAFVQLAGQQYLTPPQGDQRYLQPAEADRRYLTPPQGDQRYLKRGEATFPGLGPGYQRLPSGLILQWGNAQVGGGGNDLWFPMRFPQAVFTIQGTDTSGGMRCVLCSFRDPSHFFADGPTSAGNRYPLNLTWFAVGC